MIPMPSPRSRRISANRCSTSSRCRLLVGSSISTMRACDATARQISTTCCAAIGSAPTGRSGPQLRVREAAEDVERELLRPPSAGRRRPCDGSRPSRMFSATVRCGQSDSSWWISATPRWLASCGEAGRYGSPDSRISPSSGCSAPARTFISVLLPAPFSPMSAWTCPARSANDTPSSATVGPKRLRMPSRRSRLISPESATTGLDSTPRPSTSTSTTSPGLRNTGGFRAKPTPGGVPVAITSPGSSVTVCDRNDTMWSMPKISWSVDESCIVLPLSRRRIRSACGLPTASCVTMAGPMGAKVSHDLPRCHWPSANCRSRALTSLRFV